MSPKDSRLLRPPGTPGHNRRVLLLLLQNHRSWSQNPSHSKASPSPRLYHPRLSCLQLTPPSSRARHAWPVSQDLSSSVCLSLSLCPRSIPQGPSCSPSSPARSSSAVSLLLQPKFLPFNHSCLYPALSSVFDACPPQLKRRRVRRWTLSVLWSVFRFLPFVFFCFFNCRL